MNRAKQALRGFSAELLRVIHCGR